MRIGEKEVVEVSCDGGHGDVAGGDLEVIGRGIGRWKDVHLHAAGDVEFFLNLAELLIAGEGSPCGYIAEDSEEDGEANGFDTPTLLEYAGVLEDPGDVVAESEGDEGCDAAPDDDEVGAGVFAAQGFDDECDEGEDDEPVVDAVEGRFIADEHGCEEEIEKGNAESDGDSAAITAEEACSLKVKEAGDWN